jgi:Zn-dependent protease
MFRDTKPIVEFRGPWGVPIQISASIIALPLIIVDFGGTAQSLVYDLMFVAILVGSILLHELGHAWGSLVQGVPVQRIMLHAGGGFCERAGQAGRDQEELIVAMGPIVTLVLWAVAGLIAPFITDPEVAWVFWTVSGVNGFLAVLNLLPVQPMDCGKLFELLMLRYFHPRFAVTVCGAVGLFSAVAMLPLMLYGFISHGFLLFVVPSVLLHWRMIRQHTA